MLGVTLYKRTSIAIVYLFWFCGFVSVARGAPAPQWNIVNGLSNIIPDGVAVYTVGPHQQPFSRPPPRTIDPNIINDFIDSFSLMQDVSGSQDSIFTDTASQYVATIPRAFVEGEGGLIYDNRRNVYHLPNQFFNRTNTVTPLPVRTTDQAQRECTHYKRLATVIQRYGHMYYHFIEETLPRIILLKESGLLTPDTVLLTWGLRYERQYLELLGIPLEQTAQYDHDAVYCADTLLVPTPVPRITPARESLQAVRQELGIKVLPKQYRNNIIYVSRQNEPTRSVSNEAIILNAIQAAYPQYPLVVFKGGLDALELITLFQTAKIIIGPHGAGLSHMLFAAPGTTIIEFLFMSDPPMMFWHTAAALDQEYWMVPVPNSYYMQHDMEVPVGEVMDILQAVLNPSDAAGDYGCQPGTSGPSCNTCAAGSYAFNADSVACKTCFAGRVAETAGSSYCKTCHAGQYSNAAGTACNPCPKGTYSSIPGASNINQCLAAISRRKQLEDHAFNIELLTKLSPSFAQRMQRRALIEGGTGSLITRQELCAAHRAAGTLGDIYRGPYYMNGTDDALCAPDTIGVAPIPSPYTPEVPPIGSTPPVQPPPETKWPKQEEPIEDGDDPAYHRKKVLDGWTIALIATAGLLVLIPVTVAGVHWMAARKRHQQRKPSATAGSTVGKKGSKKGTYLPGGPTMTSSPLYELNARPGSSSSIPA